MRRVQAEAVGHGDCFFVEPLQFGIRHVLDLGRLMEQFAVEQFPAQGLGELSGHFAAAGAVLAGDGDDVHGRLLHGGAKNRPRQEILLAGPGYYPRFPYQKQILKVGVISSGFHRCV